MSAPSPPSSPRPGRSTTSIVLGVVVVMVVGVALVGLVAWAGIRYAGHDDNDQSDGALPSPSATAPMPSAPSGLGRFYAQRLTWHSCRSGDDCSTMKVPLDYAHPTARSITISVLRVRATDRSHRVGQLVVNPGGPGGSGVDFAAAGAGAVGPVLSRYFDVVGFDPRGVVRSTPLTCMDASETDQYAAADPDPDNRSETARMAQLNRDFGRDCERKDPALTKHVSTVEAAKDMDILRAALGEHQLDYFGGSYGTLLGATYAELFPTHIRRMVLDGALDPTLSNVQTSLQQAEGFQTALAAYLRDCIAHGCVLGDSVPRAEARLQQLLDQLDAQPMNTGTSRPLTEGLGLLGMIYPLYLKDYWPLLTQALTAAIRNQNGAGLLQLADQYTSRGANGYPDNSYQVFFPINCDDLDPSGIVPMSRISSYIPRFEKAAPLLGRSFAYGLAVCQDWPVRATQPPQALHAKGAPPIVVIGTTRDPATPYAWAKALSSQLDSGTLITRDGDGHTGFNRGNSCVDSAVTRYLVRGVVPKADLHC